MRSDNRGFVLLSLVVLLGVLSVLVLALVENTGRNLDHLRRHKINMSAFWLAEAGIEKALAGIEESAGSYGGETVLLGDGRFTVSVEETGEGVLTITSIGIIEQPGISAERTITLEVAIEEESGNTLRRGAWRVI